MQAALSELLRAREGHFLLESGHHGDLWLDLDALLLRPQRVAPFAEELAARLGRHGIGAVCGPLAGGAFVAQMVAAELDVEFTYSERVARSQTDAIYGAEYRIPSSFRGPIRGRPVAIVDDAINAGSAIRATYADLEGCGAQLVAVGALLVLGPEASRFTAKHSVALECLETLASGLWVPSECPFCASGVPLEDPR